MQKIWWKGLAIVLILGLFSALLLPLRADTGMKEEKVNINTASLEELQTLPNIGPKVAQRIIDFRKQNGNFKKIEELMKVRGIGEKVFNKLKPLITVEQEKSPK